MGLFSRKKKLTKEQREELDKAREELRKISKSREEEIEQLKDMEEKRKQQKNNPTPTNSTDHAYKNPESQMILEKITTMEERREADFRKKQEMFNAEVGRLPQNNSSLIKQPQDNESVDNCYFSGCKNKAGSLAGKQCKFCDNRYCLDHIQLERHDCDKTKYTKFLRKDWLRKYELDISTGLYVVVCDDCGYKSEMGRLIDVVGAEREKHISVMRCDQKKVFLEQWK